LVRIIYATHVTCDSCGAVETLPAPTERLEQTSPVGWLPPGIKIMDIYSTPFLTDLCPACMKLPLADLIEHHLERARQTP
jgi:hypothetical protein